jgi:hypothetical protein
MVHALVFDVGLAVFVLGQLAPAALVVVGARRAGLRLRAGDLATLPIYWTLISCAAWAALGELVRRPFHWTKTPHAGRAAFTGAPAAAPPPAPDR